MFKKKNPTPPKPKDPNKKPFYIGAVGAYFNFVKSFLPREKIEAFVGLDIGAREFKFVEIKFEGDQVYLVNCVIENFTEASLAESVQKALDKTQNPCRYFNTAINGKGTLIRFLDFPKMTPADFQKSFSIEVDKYFPFPPDQIYTDFHILEENPKTKTMSVVVAASKKELVDKRLETLKGLKTPIGYMGLHSIALANTAYALGFNNDATAQGAVAVLDMGGTTSTLIIFVDRLPRFTRDIHIGGQDMTKRISNALSLVPEEAEALKCDPGDKLADVNNAIESVVLSMIQEIRLSFDYFVTEKHMEVSKLYITGGAASVPGLEDFFNKNLEIPVERWKMLESAKLKFDRKTLSKAVANESKLGVALGLALYRYGAH